MEQRFKNLTIFEFQEYFPDEKACMNYLITLKWPQGFECSKCSHTKYSSGPKEHIRQCSKCHYLISPTSGTLFHKVKFPLLKAFYIIYFMSTSVKEISNTELSKRLGLRQKTCWSFKLKIKLAAKGIGKVPDKKNINM